MLQSRYSRRRETRQNSDSEEASNHSDASSATDDLVHLSDSSRESDHDEDDLPNDSDEEGSASLLSRQEQRGRTAGRAAMGNAVAAGGWGAPPDVVDKEMTWGEPTGESTKAAESTSSPDRRANKWKKNTQRSESSAPVASTSNNSGWGTVSQQTASNSEDTWGTPPSNNNDSRDLNDSWRGRSDSPGNSYGSKRGRGSAPRRARGARGGPRVFHNGFSDRNTPQSSRGGKRGFGQPRSGGDRDLGGRDRTTLDDKRSRKASPTMAAPTPDASWKVITTPEVGADSESTWGKIKTDQTDEGSWGEPSNNSNAQKDNQDLNQDSSEPAASAQNDGWGQTPVAPAPSAEDDWGQTSNTAKSGDNWGEAPAKDVSDNWGTVSAEATDDSWIGQTAQLDISDSKPRINDGEDRQRNAAYQRRLNARREYRKKLEEDPSFVPHLGEFWSHDDRFREDDMKNTMDRGRGGFRGRGRGRGASDATERSTYVPTPPINTAQRWNHDGYESLLKMEERDEQRKRNKLEHVEQEGEYGSGRLGFDGAERKRGRGRGVRGGRGRGDRYGYSTRESMTSDFKSGEKPQQQRATEELLEPSELDSQPTENNVSENIQTSAKQDEEEPSSAHHPEVAPNGDADDDSDVEIILEAPTWQSEQVLGIPTPKSTGSEKSLNGEDHVEASTSRGPSQLPGYHEDQADSPSTNWGKSNFQLSPKAASWQQQQQQQQQHEEIHEFPHEHPYPPHTMLSPNAVQFVPMTTSMGGSPSNMIPMQPMYAVPMSMSGSREGMPGPVMYAPMMNSQQGMFEANGMFYYNYDANQMQMYTPLMYYPQTPAMATENERAYRSPKWSSTRKYTQQDRPRGKQGPSGSPSQQ
ncbi:hypothetical protein Unana1_07145 [Umbelopsis nana]